MIGPGNPDHRRSIVERTSEASFNTGFVVYHDDFGDYSTNEPIMDGTASLTYLVAALVREGW